MRTVEFDFEKNIQILSSFPEGKSFTMVNMLKYRDQADYGDRTDVAPCTGREAFYERYAKLAAKLVQEDGASVFWHGSVVNTLLAPEGEDWDDILLLQYHSAQALIRHYARPEYQAIVFHRTAALADSRFIMATTTSGVG